jgi:hypothetical protein
LADIFEGMRQARILIPDNTPLSLLAMIGDEALDWLFAPGSELWVTDMVKEEALRKPDPGDDQRGVHRAVVAAWFERNKGRIQVQITDEGEEYRKAMEMWRRVPDAPLDLKPSWKGRGERSILQVLDGIEKLVADGEAVIAIVDDRRARAAIGLLTNVDIDLMATETYVFWLWKRFGVEHTDTAWLVIKMAAGGKAPDAPDEDPVHIHRMP